MNSSLGDVPSGDRNDLKSYISKIRRHGELPIELYDAVETVILRYCFFEGIRHGEHVNIGDHRRVSWHFNNDYLDGTVTVCFKSGQEWADDCNLDEVPSWFLLHILRKIRAKKPLGDQKTDEVIEMAEGFVAEQHIPNIRLNIVPAGPFTQTRRDSA